MSQFTLSIQGHKPLVGEFPTDISRDIVIGVVKLDYDQAWPADTVEDPRLRYHVSRPTRNGAPFNIEDGKIRGLPAVARFLDDRTVVMDEAKSRWLFGIECEVSGMSQDDPIARGDWNDIFRDGL